MDALKQAQQAMKAHEDALSMDDTSNAEWWWKAATAYAAIAQAEQLKRAADAQERQSKLLEAYLSVYADGGVIAIADGKYDDEEPREPSPLDNY